MPSSVVSAVVEQCLHCIHYATHVVLVARTADPDHLGFKLQLWRHMSLSDHQNRNTRGPAPDLSHGIQTIHSGHLEIQEDDIRPGLLDFLDCLPVVGGFAADFPLLSLFQQVPQRPAHKFAVVPNEDTYGRFHIGEHPGPHSTYALTQQMSAIRIA
jgi:hypothetical protein